MSNSKAASTKKFNPVQMVLMPVLGLVLVAVLFWPKANIAAPPAVAIMTVDQGDTRGTATQEVKQSRIWPVTSLEDVLAFDPFQPMKSQLSQLTSPVVPQSTQIDRLKNDTREDVVSPSNLGALQAIYFDTRGAAAILNSRVVRVGDVLANGSKVLEITAKGVAIE